jgi:hypothetical protein
VCLLLQDLVQRCLRGDGGDIGGHVLHETCVLETTMCWFVDLDRAGRDSRRDSCTDG